jgi:hypothetical protein
MNHRAVFPDSLPPPLNVPDALVKAHNEAACSGRPSCYRQASAHARMVASGWPDASRPALLAYAEEMEAHAET